MPDLQAKQALAHEYRVYSHGSTYDQRQGIRIAGEAEIEASLAGGTQVEPRIPGVIGSGRISHGFDTRRSNLCPCGIARSQSGASACGDDH
jgi:hypothetical protein